MAGQIIEVVEDAVAINGGGVEVVEGEAVAMAPSSPFAKEPLVPVSFVSPVSVTVPWNVWLPIVSKSVVFSRTSPTDVKLVMLPPELEIVVGDV